MVSATV